MNKSDAAIQALSTEVNEIKTVSLQIGWFGILCLLIKEVHVKL